MLESLLPCWTRSPRGLVTRRRKAGRQAVLMVAGMLGWAAPADGQAPPSTFPAAWRPVQEYFHRTLADEGVVGGSLMFLHGDSVLAREFHGFADLATKRAVDERTIYHWASITKTFTGIAILQLRDRGRLRLDDPILRYVPELRKIHDPYGDPSDITIRHLLSHSAGFRNPTWPWAGDKPWHPHEPTEWSQLVAMMPYTEVLFPAGTKFSYSNPGIVFLGRTIEELTGDDYEVYVEKNILRPLGMTASYFDLTPYHLLAHRSNNYDVRDGKPRANGLDFDTGLTVSNGGLNAPLADMVRYLQFLVGVPGLAVEARGVLDRRSLEEMWRPVLPVADSAGAKSWIGLTFFVVERNGLRLVGHTGSQKAFRSFVYIQPESQTGVIAAFNTAPADDPRNPTDAGPAKPRIGLIFSGLLDRLARDVFPLYSRPGAPGPSPKP
jgi:CubicO group peptidase (beta-lactamase class C family)